MRPSDIPPTPHGPATAVTQSSCCSSPSGATVPVTAAAADERKETPSSPCCGDPTPNPATGACCSAPAATCGCQSTRTAAERAESSLPVAIIGAGPVGLVAAVQLLSKGETPVLFEAGDTVGASVREWEHVSLFSPWRYVVEPTARGWLEATGWTMPEAESLPTGADLLRDWIEPLAALPRVAATLRLGHRVLSVTRRGHDKVRSDGRDSAPFELVVRTSSGDVQRVLARAVIDASGTWRSPNPLGSGGIPAEGETAVAHRIAYGLPDVLGKHRTRYAGRRVLVVGSGHSAFNVLLDLAALREADPATTIHWVIRRRSVGSLYGGGERDALAARGALGRRLARLVESGAVQLTSGLRIVRVREMADGVVAEDVDGERIGPVDAIIVATGFRPDLSLTRELRLGLDPWLEAPTALAPLIDPNLHSCGTVYPHGAHELAHPERDYYVVGMKSYGRAPTFLLLTGYEQVRSVACALTGDEEGARQVQLVLPPTGVCRTNLVDEEGTTPAGDISSTPFASAGTHGDRALAAAGDSCGCGVSARAEEHATVSAAGSWG